MKDRGGGRKIRAVNEWVSYPDSGRYRGIACKERQPEILRLLGGRRHATWKLYGRQEYDPPMIYARMLEQAQ